MARSQDSVLGKSGDDPGSRRERYHHGDLRESLIGATEALVVEKGAEHFTLADACRRAGVTTAAPYKHFRDKQEILEIICQRGLRAAARRNARRGSKPRVRGRSRHCRRWADATSALPGVSPTSSA